jgi:nucleoside phosphorylase
MENRVDAGRGVTRLPTTGPVNPDDETYLRNEVVERIADSILRGDDINLVGGWQTGKTSILYGLRGWLAEHDLASSYVDVSPWAEAIPSKWYPLLKRGIAESLLPSAQTVNQLAPLDDNTELADCLVGIVQAIYPIERFVLILDEVTGVPPILQKPFFSAIRSIQNGRQERASPKAYKALNFVFAGSFSPETLIANTHNSPFNISKTFNTVDYDFTSKEVQELLTIAHISQPAQEIIHWTNGHPYLTNALIESAQARARGIEEAAKFLVYSDRHFENLGRALSTDARARELAYQLAEGVNYPFVPGLDDRTERLATYGLVRADLDGNTILRCELYRYFLERAKPRTMVGQGSNKRPVDIALVTAMQEEFDAVLQLANDWKVEDCGQEHRTYYRRTTAQGKSIVAVRALGKGPTQAILLARDLLEAYDPKSVILVGIAGGLRDARLGDVVVSNQLIDYEPGKVTVDGLETRPDVYRSSPELLDKVQKRREDDWATRITCARPDGKQAIPKLIIGDVLSGAKVFADSGALEPLTAHWSSARAVEMESSAVAAALFGSARMIRFLMIKGISDQANSTKNDDWHPYAASAAAAFTLAFIEEL